jgi:hypothetical protein
MRFMDVHSNMQGVDQHAMEQAHRADLEIQGDEDVRFLHAWADPTSGKVFCLSEAPSRDAVLRIHQRAGHPTEEIYEVPIEIE